MSKAETTVTITHSYGLHLRAAGTLAQKASSFESEITLTMNTLTANAKSIMSVLALAAPKGATLTIQAEGNDSEEAVNSLKSLIDDDFGLGQ
jgi:phosphocarrier protein HPr